MKNKHLLKLLDLSREEIYEILDLADQLLSFSLVPDDRAAGVVMDGDSGDILLPLQPRLHLICLLHRHTLNCQTNAHPSGVFMYNTEFHAIIFL